MSDVIYCNFDKGMQIWLLASILEKTGDILVLPPYTFPDNEADK